MFVRSHLVLLAALFVASSSRTSADQTWTTLSGEATINFHRAVLEEHHINIGGGAGLQMVGNNDALLMGVDPASNLTFVTTNLRIVEMSQGQLVLPASIVIQSATGELPLSELIVEVKPGSRSDSFTARIKSDDSSPTYFNLTDGKAAMNHGQNGRQLEVRDGAIRISKELAKQLGDFSLEGVTIGQLEIFADVEFAGGDENAADIPPAAPAGGSPRGSIGPDVIVGGVGVSGENGSNQSDVVSFTPTGAIRAYSLATTSCNIGTADLSWTTCGQLSNPVCAQHPVISQNLYRLKNGRFEQLGQSWLKHGFCALDETLCSPSCPQDGCGVLGPGCSDPYTASRNSGPGLGRKSDVNAFTGRFIYPFSNGSSGSPAINGRLQVRSDDVNPAMNSGALYWAECQYTAQDDAAAGNADNNASHRPVIFNASFAMSFAAPTIQEIPAIREWKLNDPDVVETDIRVPNEGLMILAAKASDNGDGTWHYEYALFNQNSDRSAGTFSVPVGNAVITNIEFKDVDYHSGEVYSLTDWSPVLSNGVLTWSTSHTFGQNPYANALRWGTMYNFRFNANTPPRLSGGSITIGLFKFGTPGAVSASTVVPKLRGDFDENAIIDGSDFAIYLQAHGHCFAPNDPPGSLDTDTDMNGDGCVTAEDFDIWMACYRILVGDPLAPAPLPSDVGDINGDGVINASDLDRFIIIYLTSGEATFRELFVSDFDSDSDLDEIDIQAFVTRLLDT